MESDQTHVTAAPSAEVPRQRTAERSGTVAACQLLDLVRTLRTGERGYLAAVLHDGPIQELAAATLELSLAAAMGGDAGPGPGAGSLDVPQRQVEAAGRSLRHLVDELAPLPHAGLKGAGLAEVLIRRTGWLLAAPLAVDLGEGAAGLGAAEIESVADLVELMLFGAVGADAPDRALAVVRADDDLIAVELSVVVTDDPAEAGAWLNRLAAAMQTGAGVDLRGHRLRARMRIPRRARA